MRALDGVSAQSLAGFGSESLHQVLCKDLRKGTVQGIYSWGSALPGRVFAEKFSQNDGLQTAPFLCRILYIDQWKFRCSMSSGHHERGFLDPRTPWTDA